jgi:hypothetical protein
VEPQQELLYSYVKNKSYNELVEKMMMMMNTDGPQQQQQQEAKSESDDGLAKASKQDEEEKERARLLFESFLESTASQLTYHGLIELHERLSPNQLCTLFRNNHFSTLYKHPRTNKLYILVTDQGFHTHPNVVWEIFESIDGGGDFFNSEFIMSSSLSSEANESDAKFQSNDEE